MSKNREAIYLDELIMKIRENKEVGEIMGNTMIEIAKSCKTIQKEEMTHFNQIRREEVMPKLIEDKDIYCVVMDSKIHLKRIYILQMEAVKDILSIMKEEDAVFYERIEESEEPE